MKRRTYVVPVVAVGLATLLTATALAATGIEAGKPPAVTAVKVTLKAGGSALTGGDPMEFAARAKPLPRGDRLLIQERDQGARTWSNVEECGTPTCTSQWTEPGAATDLFRAIAVKRKHGSKGAIVQILARSRIVSVTWTAPPPPPPPPPPPAALAGHYCGFNDQGKSVCLDVTSDASSVTNFVTESIVTCTNSTRWQWRLTFRSNQPITNLGFTYAYSGGLTPGSSSITNLQATYSIDGTFDTAGNVNGTLALTSISWDLDGTHYSCSSAPYAWKAKLNA